MKKQPSRLLLLRRLQAGDDNPVDIVAVFRVLMDGGGIDDHRTGGAGVIESGPVAVHFDQRGMSDVQTLDGCDECQHIAGLELGFKFRDFFLGDVPQLAFGIKHLNDYSNNCIASSDVIS